MILLTESVRVEAIGRRAQIPDKDAQVQLEKALPQRPGIILQQGGLHAGLALAANQALVMVYFRFGRHCRYA